MRPVFLNPLYLICLASPLFCEENQSPDIAKLSEAMGHLIGKNLHSTGVPIDIDALVRGMKDGCKWDNSPLTEDECLQAIAALQEKTLSIESEKNLAEANEFLQRNQKQKGTLWFKAPKSMLLSPHTFGGSILSWGRTLNRQY